jgi:hypothetical protein
MRLALVPPDTRPPTRRFPLGLAQSAGLDVLTPPGAALNHLNEPGDLDLLQRWLLERAPRLGAPDPFDLGARRPEAERLLDDLLEPLARALWREHFADGAFELRWSAPSLAWPRLFTGVFPFYVARKEGVAGGPSDDRAG